jgi:hypothetical protein
VAGWWFTSGTPVPSTNETDRQDITEILLKVVLNTITSPYSYINKHCILRMATAILDFMNAQNCKIGKEPSSSVNFKPDFR